MTTEKMQQVLVIGLGMTGLSVVRFLLEQQPNCKVRVMDTRPSPPNVAQLPDNVECHVGSWQRDWVLSATQIIVSPGISLHAEPLAQAAANGVEIIGDIELFARHLNRVSPLAKVVAITGSNGKSTVTSLVGEMARAAQLAVGVGGNIGVPALSLLAQDCALYVLELSSFQLETTSSLGLCGAAFLNLSEDHMDRYADMQAYRAAKLRIFAHTKLAIYNHDDEQTKPLTPAALDCAKSFGFDAGDYRLAPYQAEIWLWAGDEPVIAAAQIGLVGKHNLANCLAAMALADAAGISRAAQIQAMRTYQGLAHRCQRVLTHQGVSWVNDSKATNPASTLAALNGLLLDGCLHLLVGGEGKNADFSVLAPALAQLEVRLYCFGKDGDQFMALASDAERFETLAQAMQKIATQVKQGDMVLLSPACASLDQFANFMARGEHFITLANQLALQRPQEA